LLPSLAEAARQVHGQLEAELAKAGRPAPPIEFITGSMFDQDLRDADVVFSNALCLSDEMMEQMRESLVRLAPGSRIILVGKHLSTLQDFTLIQSGPRQMSWGQCAVYFYTRL
jgi:hypothetical protein